MGFPTRQTLSDRVSVRQPRNGGFPHMLVACKQALLPEHQPIPIKVNTAWAGGPGLDGGLSASDHQPKLA